MRGGGRYDQSVLEQKNNRVIQLQGLVAGVPNTVAARDGKTLTFTISPFPTITRPYYCIVLRASVPVMLPNSGLPKFEVIITRTIVSERSRSPGCWGWCHLDFCQ